MRDLADRIAALHQPGLHRVQVPGIIQDQPACQECFRAWPCATYQLTKGTTHDSTS